MTYRAPVHPTALPPLLSQRVTTPDIFGMLFAEVITPDGSACVPDLHGWEVRVWPVARLGDATLEARPLYPHLDAAHLREDLDRAGVQVLGPVREKR